MRRRRRGREGGGRREGPFPTLFSPCLVGSGSLPRLRTCSSSRTRGTGGIGLGKTCAAASERENLALLAALDLGFKHIQELGGE